jgi:serine/threonine protein kinase/tetratricopeptide (TPR) repeat protein
VTLDSSAVAALPFEIGPYRIAGILGQGGMGVVYRATHGETGQSVALKTVRVLAEAQLTSIRREIHALSRIHHPGVARILDEGVCDGSPWYAMELLEGQTLSGHLKQFWAMSSTSHSLVRPAGTAELEPGAVATVNLSRGSDLQVAIPAAPRFASTESAPLLPLIVGLCRTLTYLHGEGLVHRDLKPDNVFIRQDGRPVLVDLGVAASFGGARGREELAAEGKVVGTVMYMAPEQILGELVDARADLYALGCILYECLTGQPPFTASSVSAFFSQHLNDPPVPPSRRAPDVPRALDQLVLRLLEKRPEDRLGYAGDVAEALVALGVGAPEIESAPRPRAYLYRPALAGRADALAELDAAVSRAVSRRQGSIHFFGGESGVGKTRLAMEVARRATQLGVDVVTGQCVKVGIRGEGGMTAAPLHPLRPLLMSIADRCRAHPDARAEAARLLGAGGKVLAAYEASLAELAWVAEQPEPTALAPEAARRRVLEAVEHAVFAFAGAEPLLLVLDDLQWADELSLAVLKQLSGKGLAGRKVVILGTYRMEELAGELASIVAADNVRNIVLGRLDGESVGAMVSGMLALQSPPPRLVEFLAERSDGNPFFLAEYLQTAIGEGLLTRDPDGHWHLRELGDGKDILVASLPLPRTLAELIELRLGTLHEQGRQLVMWAAVLGREFDGSLLAATAALPDVAMLETIEVLRVRQVLEETAPGRLRFVHDKIRETAYDWIPADLRRDLHRGAALAIEARAAGSPDAALDLGHHFAAAGLHGKAVVYYAQAAERARAAYANEKAVQIYRAAIQQYQARSAAASVSDGAPQDAELPSLFHLHESLGDALAPTGRQEEARAAYAAALTSGPEDDRIALARVHRKIGKTRETHHEHEEALRAHQRAEALLGLAPGDEHEAWWRAWVQIKLDQIWVYYWLARVPEMIELAAVVRPVIEVRGTPMQRAKFFQALVFTSFRRDRYRVPEETVRHARAARDAGATANETGELAMLQFGLAAALFCHDDLEDAAREMVEAVRISKHVGDVALLSRALTYLAVIFRRQRGRAAEVERCVAESQSVATSGQMTEYIGAALANEGWLLWQRRAGAQIVEEKCRAALDLWGRLSLVYPFQWVALFPLVAVEVAEGRIAEAVEHTQAMLRPTQQRLPDPVAKSLEDGGAAFARGDAEAARRYLGDALRQAEESGYL